MSAPIFRPTKTPAFGPNCPFPTSALGRLAACLLIFGASLCGSVVLADSGPAVRVITHVETAFSNLSDAEIASIFLGQTTEWADGSPIEAVDLPLDSPTRRAFSEYFLGRNTSSIRSYWQRMIFAGKGVPPEELPSDGSVLDFVAGNPGAIGYVDFDLPLPPSVTTLASGGRARGTGQSANGGDSAGAGFRTEPQVLAQMGSIHLLAVGPCGHSGDGQEIVLVNRNPDYPVDARIEAAVRRDGKIRSTAPKVYSLAPFEERNLGCADPENGPSYALVGVSDARRAQNDYGHDTRSPRQSLRMVEGASCGRGRLGHQIVLENRHPFESVRAKAVIRVSTDGSSRTQPQTFTLAPGQQKKLGCSLDGPLERTVTLEEVSFR